MLCGGGVSKDKDELAPGYSLSADLYKSQKVDDKPNNFKKLCLKLSAQNESSLNSIARSYKDLLNEESVDARELCSTSYYCSKEYQQCLYVWGEDKNSLSQALSRFIQNPKDLCADGFERSELIKNNAKVAFVFSGNATQYKGMGKLLLENVPLFAKFLSKVDQCLAKYQTWSVIDLIRKDDSEWNIDNTEIAQPLIFAIQASLISYLRYYGVEADTAIGHSVGEVASIYYCGGISLYEACRVIVCRSKNQHRTLNSGDMAVIKASRATLDELLVKKEFLGVEIAASNTDDSFTLSGDKAALESFVNYAKGSLGHASKLLSLNYPFHSSKMDAIKASLNQDLHDLCFKPLKKDFYSTVFGLYKAGELLPQDYFWHNIRAEVKFEKTVRSLLLNGYRSFLELGGKSILINYIKDIARKDNISVETFVFNTKVSSKEDFFKARTALLSSPFFKNEGALFDKNAINRGLRLPLYPFCREYCLTPISSESSRLFMYGYSDVLGRPLSLCNDAYLNELDLTRKPYLKGHVVKKEVVFPMAGSIDMLTTLIFGASPDKYAALDDFMVLSALELKSDSTVNIKCCLEGGRAEISIKEYGDSSSYEPYVKATAAGNAPLPIVDKNLMRTSCNEAIKTGQRIDESCLYSLASDLGINYNGGFRAICDIRFLTKSAKELWIVLKNPTCLEATKLLGDKVDSCNDASHYAKDEGKLSVFAIDGALQALFAFILRSREERNQLPENSDIYELSCKLSEISDLMLPSNISRIRMIRGVLAGKRVFAKVILTHASFESCVLDILYFNEDFELLLSLEGIRYLRFARGASHRRGLFQEKLRALPSLVVEPSLLRVGKEELARELSLKALRDDLKSRRDHYDLMELLCLSYLNQYLTLTGKKADLYELFGGRLIPGFNEELAYYLLDLLSKLGFAEKYSDFEYRVDESFNLGVKPEELFNVVIAKDASLFAQAELICRVGKSLVDIINGEKSFNKVVGCGKDNIFSSYLSLNERVLGIEDALAAFITKRLSSFENKDGKCTRVLEVYYQGSHLRERLDVLTQDQRYEYHILVNDENQQVELNVAYASCANVHIIGVSDLQPYYYDLLILPNVLGFKSVSIKLKQLLASLKTCGLILGYEGILGITLSDSLILSCAASIARSPLTLTELNRDFASCEELFAADLSNYRIFAYTFDSEKSNCLNVDDKSHEIFNKLSLESATDHSARTGIKSDSSFTKIYSLNVSKDGNIIHSDANLSVDSLREFVPSKKEITSCGSNGSSVAFCYLLAHVAASASPQDLEHTSSVLSADTLPVKIYSLQELGLEKISAKTRIIIDLSLDKNLSAGELASTAADIGSSLVRVSELSLGRDALIHALVSDVKNPQSWAIMCMLRSLRNELGLKLRCISVDTEVLSCEGKRGNLLRQALAAELSAQGPDEVILRDGERLGVILDEEYQIQPYGDNHVYIEDTFKADHESLELSLINEDKTHPSVIRNDGSLCISRLECAKPGNLKTLRYKNINLKPLEDDEVLVEVRASGLNYRDVMWALGILPAEALEGGFAGASLGMECSGVVIALGDNVNSLKIGDRVLAFAQSCFASHIVTPADAVIKLPANLSFEAAASIPVCFLTAYYSIVYQARAEFGEKILIHGAAGGVGLAAIQISKDLGLEIYATAGSNGKRDLLSRLGIKHIYDSRSLSFEEGILKDTNGKGVDIVLNSLYKAGAYASLKLLKPFGRFVELGKRDFFENNTLFLKAFKDNLTYFGVDVDEILICKKPLALRLIHEVLDKFKNGVYYPNLSVVYPSSLTQKAFLDMKASMHIGKLVIRQNDGLTGLAVSEAKLGTDGNLGVADPLMPYKAAKSCNAPKGCLSKDDSFITSSGNGCDLNRFSIPNDFKCGQDSEDLACVITGGMGGLGFTLASYLMSKGYRRLYLIGRRKLDDDIERKLATLREKSTCKKELVLSYSSVDVTDNEAVRKFMARIKDECLEGIGTIYHASVVLHDDYAKNLSLDDYLSLIKIKINGALSFLACSNLVKIRRMVFFSSVSTLFGNEAQANYVFSNAYLEGMALNPNRVSSLLGKNMSLPKLTAFLLGPVGKVGLLEGKNKLLSIFEEKLGLAPLDPELTVKTIVENEDKGGVIAIADLVLSKLTGIKTLAESRFDKLRARYQLTLHKADSSLLERLMAVSETEASELLSARIASILAEQLGTVGSKISLTKPLLDLGIDSLSLMETLVVLEKELSIKLSVSQVSGERSIRDIALMCVRRLNAQEDSADTMISDMERQSGLELKDEIKAASVKQSPYG